MYDSFSAVARQKLGKDETFSVYKIERMAGGYLLEGSTHTVITRGKNKGKKKWVGKGEQCICTTDELASMEALYEKSSGNCAKCEGTGQTMQSWNVVHGKTYRTCERCNGSGHGKHE